MKFFRIDLLTMLISLFILGSCKNPDEVGLPIDPTQALQTNLIDTATISTLTVLDNDSVTTSNVSKAPLAWFKDPVFGTTEANIAAALNLPTANSGTAYTVPTGTITIDSAVLVLNYADGFYGDSLTTNYKVNVYQLNEPVINGHAYSNLKTWTTSTFLGSRNFFPRPKSGFKITDVVTGAPDTLKKVGPQLRIKIDPTWVNTKFFNAPTNKLSNNSVFQNYIYGLYIALDHGTTGVGGNMYFNMTADTTTRLDVYYKATDAGVIDTGKVSMRVGGPHAVQIAHKYTTGAASLNTQLATPTTTSSFNTVYLQGLGGLRAKIAFPYLKNILAAQPAGTDIVLNRAELVVTPVTGTDIPFAATPRLTMYRYDIALQRQLIPDAYAGDLHFIAVGSFGGFYDPYHKSYHYVITGYVENLMRGKTIDYGTYISPTDTAGVSSGSATVSISNSLDVAGRAVVGGDKTSAFKMKLNILYSKVTK